jgi:ribonuclease M5
MKKVLIVEGKNDCARVKQLFPELDVLTTNGSEVSEEFLGLIKMLSVDHEVILLLDPDYQGEAIRRKITAVCPNASHAFVPREEAISKNGKKIGVEHVDLNVLKESLEKIVKVNKQENICFQDLYDLGLIGTKGSKIKRDKLCKALNIGHVNGKQLVNRLNLFNLTLEQIKEII